MPAILQRPQPLLIDERLRPLDDAVVDSARSFSERPPDLVDGNRRQRVLVHVHPDHDHRYRLLPLGATGERTDLTRGSCQAPIRSRSTVSRRRRRHNAGKSAQDDDRE
jgi:hypothetical protein